MNYKIRQLLPSHCWDFSDIIIDNYHFSQSFDLSESSAVLCESDAVYENLQWQREFLSFPGPKAWYCGEADLDNKKPFNSQQMLQFRKQLMPDEYLYYGHPNKAYRVPHVTHLSAHGDLYVRRNLPRLFKAVAIVSNITDPPSVRSKEASLRINYITHPQVDLFGRLTKWQDFQFEEGCKPSIPANYKGELRGYWDDPIRIDHMAKYKVSICMENTLEPYYFTEKFVGAVQAGCIPIYHAENTVVKPNILKGAKWVDPADFNFDVSETIKFALQENTEEYWDVNSRWLELRYDFLESTSSDAIYRKIGNILRNKYKAT